VTISRRKLEIVRWVLAALVVALFVVNWVYEPQGGTALALFFALMLFGFPAAMLSLLLHPPKFFKHSERR